MSEESIADRLARIRARSRSSSSEAAASVAGGSSDAGGSASAGAGSDASGTAGQSAAERLAALREKKRKLKVGTSVKLGRGEKGSPKKRDEEGEPAAPPADASDDEGASSEDSEVDDEGKPILAEDARIKPLTDADQPLVLVRKSVAVSSLGFVPQPKSVSRLHEPHVVAPGTGAAASRLSSVRRRAQAARNNMALHAIPAQVVLREPGLMDPDQTVAAVLEDEALLTQVLFEEGFFEPVAAKAAVRANVARLEDRLLREQEQDVVAAKARVVRAAAEQENRQQASNMERFGVAGGAAPAPAPLAPGQPRLIEESAGDFTSLSRSLVQQLAPPSSAELFTAGGAMNVEADPCKATLVQPADSDPILADLEQLERCATHIVPPRESLAAMANPTGAVPACMDVTVHTIAFDDHPLFIEEDAAAAKLRGLFRKYQQRVRDNLADHLTAHINALMLHEQSLRSGLKESRAAAADDSEKLFAVHRQVLDMFSRRLGEELEVRELARETYDQWVEVKRLRAVQGFSSTNVRVAVMRTESRYSGLELQQQFKFVSRIVERMADDQHAAQVSSVLGAGAGAGQQVVSKIAGMIAGKVGGGGGGSGGAGGAGERASRLTPQQLAKAQETLRRYELTRPTRRASKRRNAEAGDPDDLIEDYALRLTEDGIYSKDDEVPQEELKRRRAIRHERMFVKVFVNGHAVARTGSAALSFPGFCASWKRVLRLQLIQRPRSIRMEVRSKGTLLSPLLATVHVPVPASQFSSPGLLAPAVGPEDVWHEFAGQHSIYRWLWERPAQQLRSIKDVYTGQLEGGQAPLVTGAALDDRFSSGLLRACVGWSTPSNAPSLADKLAAERRRAGAEGSSGEDQRRHAEEGEALDNSEALLVATADVALPEPTSFHGRSRERFVGAAASDASGGARNGGGAGGVSGDAVEFDDQIPDFANEVDFQELLETLAGLDPNDPRNGGVLRLLEVIKWSGKRGVLFRPEAMLRDALFPTANPEKFIESRRVALLKLRKEKPHAFHQPIPFTEEEIKEVDAFQTLLLPVEAQLELLDDEAAGAAGGRSAGEVARMQRLQRSRITDFLQSVRDLQANSERVVRKREVPLSSVLKEGPLPEFSFDADAFKALFAPRRRLRPAAKPRKAASLSVEQANIFVQVVRAVNVPVRRQAVAGGIYPASPSRLAAQASPGMAGAGGQGAQLSPNSRAAAAQAQAPGNDEGDDSEPGVVPPPERVMCFCQVRFQGSARRTAAQEGPSPTWNESLFLPFVPPRKDFSPSNLQSISDNVWFNLFDEVVVDAVPEDYRNEDAMFQRRERRYLGSFAVPFSTIYLNGRVEGMFRVETPDVNLGYVSRSRGVAQDDRVDSKGGLAQVARALQDDAANATYVYLMATLDPMLATAKEEENEYGLGAGENTRVVGYAKQWMRSVQKRTKRKSSIDVTNVFGAGLTGDAIFAPRFIAPQVPPTGKDGTELVNIPALARFVSLVPFLDDWQAFIDGGNDVWCDSQKFLDISAGDWEEHAILLCNYFNWLFKDRSTVKAYVVVGRGVPEGETIYTMLADTAETTRLLFNASTGRAYLATDKHCPLVDVGLVFNDTNIWANLQETGAPGKLRWNMDNKKDWASFWDDKHPRIELPSVQHEVLKYEPQDHRFVTYLEGEIADVIQKGMRKWRAKRGTTRFNKIVGRKLRALLESLEDRKVGTMGYTTGPDLTIQTGDAATKTVAQEHFEALKDTLNTNHMFGFPINLTFTELDSVVKAVRNTEIHNTTVDNVTFALGVLVVPYTGKVFSVWVYLAAIAPIVER